MTPGTVASVVGAMVEARPGGMALETPSNVLFRSASGAGEDMKRLAIVAVFAALASSAFAVTFNFEGFAKGTWMREQYAAQGLHISASNPSGPDKAIIFDSSNPTGGDFDLATPGYHPSNTTSLGGILIIAENDTDNNGDGFVDDPDDEGDQPAGWIRFRFDNAMSAGSLTLIDIEEGGGKIEFYRSGVNGPVNTLNILAKGDNSVQTMTWSNLSYDSMKVHLKGSGAMDNLSAVPEPGTIAALGLGAALLLRRRRASKAN
jgi:hypothetical protein